jgi:predicted CXXCH cytochrome family protein
VFSKKLIIFSTIIIFIGVFLWGGQPVYADEPSPDTACRQCHSDTEQELTLPSGETLPLQVPLDLLDNSPHNTSNETPVTCTNCHRPRVNYQFPHAPNPAQTQQEFVAAMEETCQDCHYPHNPFHPDESDADLPTCTTCHGSHDIDYVQNIADHMPNACVSCHTDQTAEWAADLIAPRPGLGKPAEGYAGSFRCGGCHEERYLTWRETLHARLIQDPAADPSVVLGDFESDDPDLTFSLDDVVFTIGSRWKQQYLSRDEDGNFFVLPAQWNVATAEWVPYDVDNWQQECSGCHVTGLDTETWEFAEFSLGCESCHGPAAEHAANPEKVKPFTEVDDQVCGSCHSRGISPDDHPFPATFRPGDTLTDHFTFTTADADLWPDGSGKKNNMQYTDWQLGSGMNVLPDVTCVSCHTVHESGSEPGQLVAPLNQVCVQCHTNKKRVIEHTPYHDIPASENDYEYLCSDCHMPRIAASAVPYDIHNHAFLQPNPQASIDHGGLENMPNACNTCHTALAETPQWAADTIAFAAQTIEPTPVAALGPGPRPMSPPPPTAIPAAGQKANAEHYQIEGSRWLRNIFLITAGLVIIGMGYGVYRFIKSRRLTNA